MTAPLYNPGTNRQVPNDSILDVIGNRQTYLGNRYTFSLAFTLAGTSEANAFLLSNALVTTAAFPTQASLFVDLAAITETTASSSALLRVYLGPTGVSGGTTKTPLNLRTGSGSVSIATLKSAPTATPGSTIYGTVGSSTNVTQRLQQMIVVDPGKTLLFTIQGATSDVVNLELGWNEI